MNIREKIRHLSPEQRIQRSEVLCAMIADHPLWKSATIVGAFLGLPSEPDLSGLWQIAGTRVLALPAMNGQQIAYHRCDDLALTVMGPMKFREPPPSPNTWVAPSEIDLLLVPGMGFTHDGVRLGRGKGFYDRYLSKPDMRCHCIGICFREQLVPSLPQEPHDVIMHEVLAV